MGKGEARLPSELCLSLKCEINPVRVVKPDSVFGLINLLLFFDFLFGQMSQKLLPRSAGQSICLATQASNEKKASNEK